MKDFRLRLKKQELRRLYLKEKRSLEDIARLYGVSRVAVWKYCKAEGLNRRNRSEARLEAQKRGKVPQNYYEINDRFFGKWSSEMAYVLGLFATDGCISKSGTMSLCINDKELLEKVRSVMDSSHKIKHSSHQEGLYTFRFSREKLVSDLNSLGIFPKKSLNIKFPDVPNIFLTDFIRGVFDGDGSVFFEKRSVKFPLRASFVSSSPKFIETLQLKLQILGMPRKKIWLQKTKNAISFLLRYAHRDSVRLFKILYKDVPAKKLFLARKYNKFLEGFRMAKH